MNAQSSTFGADRHSANGNATSLRWAALCEAGKVVALLAGNKPEQPDRAVRNFPALIRDAEPWRRDLAANGCIDLAAMMEPGITALLAINARGADCRPAARALWQEFVAARDSMLALLPPSGELGPRRSA